MTDKVRNILLIGRTGNGKSTLANVLIGADKFKESEMSVSETKEIQVEEFEDSVTKDGAEKIKYQIIDTIGIGDTTLEPREVMGRIAKVAHFIKESGLSRILFIVKGRFTKEEIDAYNLLRAVIFDPEVIRFTTVVRTGFPSFRIPEKCGEDKQKLINENQELADIIKNKIIYVNNPPINTGDEDSDRVGMNTRLESRNFLLTHLNACGDEVYKPANLDDINERISGYMTESEQNAKMIEELTKTLEEEKDLSKKEREEMTKKLEQADIDRKQAVEKANGELMRALKENKEMFNQQTREQGEKFNKVLSSINEDKNELRELLRRREEELGKSRLEMEARGAEVQSRIDQREKELQVVREELQRSRKEAKQNARKFNESDEKMRELERQIAQIEQKGGCKLS